MFRLIDFIFGPIISYFVLTVVEPFSVLFNGGEERRPEPKKPRKRTQTGTFMVPSVIRTICNQRKMVSPNETYVQLSPDISVTEEYRRRTEKLSERIAQRENSTSSSIIH